MRHIGKLALASVSLWAMAAPAFAQDASETEDSLAGGDIIVQARRRDESLIDVPQTVNVVTAQQLEKLNLRNFTEIQSLVAGLQLTAASAFSNTSTVRGIAFDPVASGNNPSVEFYLNDGPITAGFLFQSVYDFGQFELQRGPQGTLRGRASPSGSVAVSTRRPDLDKVGVVMNGTVTNLDANKIDGAFNLPIIAGVLAVRVAGVVDDNRANRVHSLAEDTSPGVSKDIYRRVNSIRGTARFEPTDWLAMNFMYQGMHTEDHTYGQLVSESLVNPAAAAATTTIIRPFDRLGTDEQGSYSRQDYDIFNGHVDIRFAGQKLSYVGSYNKADFGILGAGDAGNYFRAPNLAIVARPSIDIAGLDPVCGRESARSQASLTTGGYVQCTHSQAKRKSHELRLASEDRIAGIFEYVVGLFYDHNDNRSDLTVETPIFLGATPATGAIANPGLINRTGIISVGENTEKSAFGNLTANLLEDRLELSGGLRYIDYRSRNSLFQSSGTGTVLCDGNAATTTRCTVTNNGQDANATIYMASVKYKISPDVMVYALTGSSWRAGPRVIGIFSLGPNRQGQTARELSFLNLPPETSKSYEIGAKTSFLGGRGRFNISAYYQKFKNYPFFGPQVFYISTNATGVESVATANTPGGSGFVSPVPVTVKGVELETSYQIMKRWSLSLNAAYADGKIKNGTIACTDLNGDGVPDVNPARPTVAQLQAAVGAGQTIGRCTGFNGRSGVAPKFSANAQTEFDFDVGPRMDGFFRGLYSFYGKTVGSQSNLLDDVGAYGLLNLYAGLRDKEGRWEISVFGKNILRERTILTLGASPASTNYQIGGTAATFISEYRALTVTAPREFGISGRIALGSR